MASVASSASRKATCVEEKHTARCTGAATVTPSNPSGGSSFPRETKSWVRTLSPPCHGLRISMTVDAPSVAYIE
ncbi:MAG: hypothetical protein ACLUZZ_00935 [Alistipes inops]